MWPLECFSCSGLGCRCHTMCACAALNQKALLCHDWRCCVIRSHHHPLHQCDSGLLLQKVVCGNRECQLHRGVRDVSHCAMTLLCHHPCIWHLILAFHLRNRLRGPRDFAQGRKNTLHIESWECVRHGSATVCHRIPCHWLLVCTWFACIIVHKHCATGRS